MFNKDVDYVYNWYDNNAKYMAQHGHYDNGKGDGLYRTSLAYIAYGDKVLKESILSSFREFTMINKSHRNCVQGARAPFRHREDDFSRDQYILAISALYLRGDHNEVLDITSKIPYRLSRRFRMTPTLWCWTKYLQGKNKTFNLVMYRTLELLSQLFIIPISKLGQCITGRTTYYSISELMSIDPNLPYWHYDNKNKEWIYKTVPSFTMTLAHKLGNKHLMKKSTKWWYKLGSNLITPGYANSLGAYMASIAAGRLLKSVLLTNIPKFNIVQRILLNDKRLNLDDAIKDYKNVAGYIWNDDFLGFNISYELDERDVEFNNVPFDIVTYLSNAKV